jgi:hypothetical protein
MYIHLLLVSVYKVLPGNFLVFCVVLWTETRRAGWAVVLFLHSKSSLTLVRQMFQDHVIIVDIKYHVRQ